MLFLIPQDGGLGRGRVGSRPFGLGLESGVFGHKQAHRPAIELRAWRVSSFERRENQGHHTKVESARGDDTGGIKKNPSLGHNVTRL